MYIDVIIPRAINKSLTYRANKPQSYSVGERVLIPLGKSCLVGFVERVHSEAPDFKTIKEVHGPMDPFPLLSEKYLNWIRWAANYYHHPIGEILKMVIPNGFWEQANWDSLGTKKARKSTQPAFKSETKELNTKQAIIVKSIADTQGCYQPHLLWGVTGSGKTEVYIKLAQEVLNQGKEVLVLVPEIGLTPQIALRFLNYFNRETALYHSNLSENAKLLSWIQILKEETKIIIGTRSALFAPFKNLGLIIVDEEHDGSYKQEDRFKYQARDLAIVRAKTENIPIVLGSATPSLESYQNAIQNRYELHTLHERANQAQKPTVLRLDWAAEKRQTHTPLTLSTNLHRAMTETLAKKEQVILFINRRGFASSLFCLNCSKGVMCPDCSVTLTYHKSDNKLHCHHCDHKIILPKKCPDCQGEQTMLTGLGSQTIEEEVKTFFPKAKVARMDRDNLKSRKSLEEMLSSFRNGNIDILIGTQMIAKGHDFPNVTLVGIIGADFGMGLPDFRANERTFQLLCQVTGRAGRGAKPGRVFIQTYIPEHPLMQLAENQDYIAFATHELKERKELNYPPYGRLVLFEFSAKDLSQLEQFIKSIPVHQFLHPKCTLLGPSPAPLEKVQSWHRQHILLRSQDRQALHIVTGSLLNYLKKEAPRHIKWAIDVDPLNML